MAALFATNCEQQAVAKDKQFLLIITRKSFSCTIYGGETGMHSEFFSNNSMALFIRFFISSSFSIFHFFNLFKQIDQTLIFLLFFSASTASWYGQKEYVCSPKTYEHSIVLSSFSTEWYPLLFIVLQIMLHSLQILTDLHSESQLLESL